MDKYTIFRTAGLLVTLLYLLAGCTGLNTLPMSARGGDTVLMAAGSPEGMSKDNITVQFTSDVDGSVVDLTPNVISLLKFYPDKTSSTALNDTNAFFKQGHEPWLSTVVINLPLSIADGGTLTVGTGSLRISCVPRESCTYPILVPHNNDVDISIEILPGTGQPNPFLYDIGIINANATADPASLQAQQQAQVIARYPGGITFTEVLGPIMGAAEFVVKVPMTDIFGGSVPDERIVIVTEDITSYSGSQRNIVWKRQGDDFTVMFISPHGMKFTELRFSIVTKTDVSTGSELPFLFTATPSVVSEKYYDLNGDLINTDLPTLDVSLVGSPPTQ